MTPRLALMLLYPLCLLASALAALRLAWAILVSPARAWRLAVAHDQLANAAANGSEDETISSRAGKAAGNGQRWGCILCKLLDKIDPGHCERNIEPDE
ncbi:MAG TPA: hypothetical protein VJ603_00995 [Paucimonas sp.]|nr:hypothetical protein [Paucimonas sp.]